MLQSILLVWRTGAIRAAALTLFCLGLSSAASSPYLSIVAIKELHMQDADFSALLMASAVASVIIAVWLGALSDHVSDRKPMILLTTASGILGYGLLFAFPSIPFLLALALVFGPVCGATFSLLFSSVKASTSAMNAADSASVTSAVRMFFSAAYMLVPGAVGLWLATRAHMTEAFGISAFGMVLCCATYLFLGTSGKGQAGPQAAKPTLAETFRLVLAPNLLLPILALAVLTAPQRMNATISPLIMIGKLGGSTADVGLIAGTLALLELPCLILWGDLQRRTSTAFVLIAGGLIYCLYLVGLGFATAPWQIYALVILNAVGSSALLSAPMSYLQDLLPERPGLGTSLLLLSVFVCDSLNALTFAVGTRITDYAGTALIGAAITALGCACIGWIERQRRP